MGDEDKSFEASAQKLKKARENGQVIKSKDLSTAIFIVTMFLLLTVMYGPLWEVLSTTFILYFEQVEHQHIENIDWQLLMFFAVRCFALTVVPFLGVAFIIAVAGDMFQVGLLFTIKPIMPKPDKLNPVKGFKNIFSKRSLVELIKNILKITVLAACAVIVFYLHLGELVAVGSADNIFAILFVLGEVITQFIFIAGVAFFLIGAGDYMYQRSKFLKDQKMSMKEVKDEYKQSEGDPMVKAVLRQRRMQMLQQRMLEAVPNADVVATNPIHVAVALKYEIEEMAAPRVIAKGAEVFAERIKGIAKKHEIPVVENPVVARTLYQVVDVDQEIPADMYQAVAEILMFAWQMKGQMPDGVAKPSEDPNSLEES